MIKIDEQLADAFFLTGFIATFFPSLVFFPTAIFGFITFRWTRHLWSSFDFVLTFQKKAQCQQKGFVHSTLLMVKGRGSLMKKKRKFEIEFNRSKPILYRLYKTKGALFRSGFVGWSFLFASLLLSTLRSDQTFTVRI